MLDLNRLPDGDYAANLLAALVDDARELELHAQFLPHINHHLNCRLDPENNIVYVECVTCDRVVLNLQGDDTDEMDDPGDGIFLVDLDDEEDGSSD